jgi:hypothetical protein
MRWASRIRSLAGRAAEKQNGRRARTVLELELLEDRVVPYSVSGNVWPQPNLITISFMPDGTPLSSAIGSTITSNLFSAFNAKFGSTAAWENQILKAAQVWAQQTNINFAVVSDSGAPSGSGSYEQGNISFGDIRIGGYVFGNSSLATTYMPPSVNNYSLAGDITFNTGQSFHVGSTYDLFTVATHEFGHALGLQHSSSGNSSIMYPSYTGAKNGLSNDDIAGIRNIYSSNAARTPDAYDAGTGNNTQATATNIASFINTTSLTAQVGNLDITTTSDVDYYTFTAPTGTSKTMKVQVQSKGLSLLSPSVTVYSSTGSTLGSASGLNQYGTTLTVSVSNVSAGQKFYVKVQGADNTAFSTGAYALALNFGTGTTPVVASPNTLTLNGTPVSGGGGAADGSGAGDTYLNNVPTITGITPDTGSSSNDAITNARNISLLGQAPEGNTVQVFLLANDGSGTTTLLGSVVAGNNNTWTFDYTGTTLSDGSYNFVADALDNLGNVSPYSSPLTTVIDTTPPASPVIGGITPDTGASSTDGLTNATQPTVYGTAEANSSVQILRNGGNAATVQADSLGNWSYKPNGSLSDGTYSFTATATDVAGNTGPVSNPYSIIIDTHAPNAPAINGITPDTGASATDGITRAQQIEVLGTAVANLKVTVSLNGVVAGSTTADGNGNWIFDYRGTTLAAGTYTLTAATTDLAGNVSSTSQSYTLIVATTPPAAPLLTGISPDTGTSSTDKVTSSRTFTIAGTGVANDTVNVYLNGTSIGSAVVAGSGQWTFPNAGPALADGSYGFTATVTDIAGNTSLLSSVMTVVVDGTAPNAPVISGFSTDSGVVGDHITNYTTPTLSGTAEANSTVIVYRNGSSVGTVTASSTGAWSYLNSTLSDGTYTFTATATDLAGNVSLVSAPFNITIVTKISTPQVTGISPDTGASSTDGVTQAKNISLVGKAGANNTVQVLKGGTAVGSTVADGNGNWTFNYTGTTLSAGTYYFTAKATDVAGNVSSVSATFTVVVDYTAPLAPVISGFTPDTGVVGDHITNATTPTLTGTAEANSFVTIYSGGSAVGTTKASSTGVWSYTNSALSAGTYTFTATATDLAGNVSPVSSSLAITIDTQVPAAPVLTGITPDSGIVGDGITNTSTPALFGTAEANSTVTVYRGGSRLGTVTANSTGAWSYLNSTLSDGTYAFTVTATDVAGNVSLASAPYNVTTLTKIATPQITGISPDTGASSTDGVTQATNIALSGKASANNTVQLFQGNTSIGSTVSDNNGNWTFNYTGTTLTTGTYYFTAKATDVAGNVSAVSATFTVVVDHTAPNAPVISGFGTDSGVVGDHITNYTTPTLSGTAAANSTVTVYRNGSSVGTVTASSLGVWSYTNSTLSDGTYTFTATAADLAGNVSLASAPFNITIVTKIGTPQITGISPDTGANSTDGVTQAKNISLVGKAGANNTVQVLKGGTAVGSTVADGNGNWTFNYTGTTLTSGTYYFTAKATDVAGNVSSVSATFTVVVDYTAPNTPVISGFTPDSGVVGDHITNAATPTLTGTAEANSFVTIYSGGSAVGTTKASSTGVWSYTSGTLSDGTYAFTATATDLAGNVSPVSTSLTITIRTKIGTPQFTGISPDTGASSTDQITQARNIVLAGKADAGDPIQLFRGGVSIGSTTTASNGTWSFSYTGTTLADGTYSFTAQATDVAGNSALSTPLTVVIDGTAPLAPVFTGISPDSGVVGDGITNATTPTISGTAVANSTVTVYRGGSAIGIATTSGSGVWSYTSSTLTDGTYTFTAIATDLAGNVSPVSAPLSITIDTRAPNAPVITGITPDSGIAGDGITNAQQIKILGTAAANSTVTVSVNGVVVGSTATDSNGNWIFDYTGTTLANGTYSLTATASDVAGNVSTLSNNFTVVVNTTAPVVVIADVAEAVDANNIATLTLSGTVEPQSQVQVFLNGAILGTVAADNNGNWTYSYQPSGLPDGTYTFTAVATDLAGNTGSATDNLVLGNGALTAPAPTLAAASIIDTASDGTPIAVSNPTLSGTTGAGDLVTIVDGNTILGTVVADSQGQWTFVSPLLATGRHNVGVSITDPLGETGLLSDVVTFQV